MNQTAHGSGRLIAGDPLRAIAALSVLVFHVAAASATRPGAEEAFGPAFRVLLSLDIGLYLFFALSGFLLTRPFAAALLDGAPPPPVGPYVRNRLLRIVPAFWAVLTLLFLVRGASGAGLADVAGAYFFVQTWVDPLASREIVQAWTLHVELVFYLALPVGALALTAVARRLPSRRRRAVLAVLAAVATGVVSGLVRAAAPPEVEWLRSFAAVAFAFVPGVLLAIAQVLRPRLVPRRGLERAWLATGILLLAGYVSTDGDQAVLRPMIATLASGALLAALVLRQASRGDTWRPLDGPALHAIGRRSYSLYLVHLAIVGALSGLILRGSPAEGFLLALPVALGLSLLVADLSFRLVERPALRLRARWRPPDEQRDGTASS